MFCYIMSLGSSLRRIDTISKALGWVLNASCYVLGFFIFLLCLKMSLPSALILVVAFIPIYAIAAVSVALYERRGASVKKAKPVHKGAVKSKKSKKRKDNETYTSMFS